MILLVQSIEEVPTKSGDSTYLLVKGINTQTQKEGEVRIFKEMKDKWGLIEKNKPIELKMKKSGKASFERGPLHGKSSQLLPPQEGNWKTLANPIQMKFL